MNRGASLLVTAAAVLFFTSSFDVFLSVNLGPTVRVAQLFALLLVAAALFASKLGRTMEVPLGGWFLIAWWGVQLAFVPVADFWEKSLSYCVWLALNIALLFAMVNLFAGDPERLRRLLRLYLLSFVFVAVFGIVQFALPLAGGPGLLVQQWWLPGSVPRVNGFSYEPSYYASYLIMGFVCLGSLRRVGVAPFRTWAWTLAYLVEFVALILCSSRIGIAFALLELATAPLGGLWRTIRSPRRVLGFHVSVVKILASAAALGAVTFAVAWTADWVREDQETVRVLVNGTGLLGTGAHSVAEREDHLDSTLQTIADHPWIGQSLGGVTEAVASYSGVRPMNFEEAKYFEGQSIFAEAVAAGGVPGSIPFFCFLAVAFAAPLRLARRAPPLYAAWLRALAYALAFELAILQFNQNILRLYLWVHIAVLAVVYASARREVDGLTASGFIDAEISRIL